MYVPRRSYMRDIHECTDSNYITGLTTAELRQKWADAWGIVPHRYIRREMLEKSLIFKIKEINGRGLTPEQQVRLNKMVRLYKKNPRHFDETSTQIKVGMRLSRMWKGKKYHVLVVENGFDCEGTIYSSLSEVASYITGTRWNGWVFFGIKNKRSTS